MLTMFLVARLQNHIVGSAFVGLDRGAHSLLVSNRTQQNACAEHTSATQERKVFTAMLKPARVWGALLAPSQMVPWRIQKIAFAATLGVQEHTMVCIAAPLTTNVRRR